MVSAFDQRIIKATIEFEDGISTFEGLSIRATGQKFMSALQGSCSCVIYNLTRDQRNYILSRTSPLNPNRGTIRFTLEVGRESYGTFLLFSGSIWKSGMTQPPDIGIILESYTGTNYTVQTTSKTFPPYTQLSQLARSVAADLGLTLINHATDKTIANVAHSGSVNEQLQQLNNTGEVVAYVDNGNLYLLNARSPLPGTARIVNSSTGMIGIPQITDYGVSVGVMMDNTINLGGKVAIQSMENPAANGEYYVQKINYDVANREQPFWQMIDCYAPQYAYGSVS